MDVCGCQAQHSGGKKYEFVQEARAECVPDFCLMQEKDAGKPNAVNREPYCICWLLVRQAIPNCINSSIK